MTLSNAFSHNSKKLAPAYFFKREALVGGVLLVLITAFGCAGVVQESPKRLSQPNQEYPVSKYMTVKGMGQTEAEAGKQAIAELSGIFESKVISNTSSKIKSIVDTTGNESLEKAVESNIRIISAVELKGVKIGKRWFDEKTKMYHALAVLDRHMAKDNWEKESANIDLMIESEFKAMNSLKSKLMKLKSLRKIQNFWIKREVIATRLRVLGFDDVIQGSYDIKSVFFNITKIKTEMLIFVEINGEQAKWIEDKLSESLTKAGFAISETRDRANVLVTGTVKTEPVNLNNPEWEFARATVSLRITDSDTEINAGEISKSTRAGHLSYKEAINKAVKKISSSVSNELIKYFDQMD